jgi:hypothetical protein
MARRMRTRPLMVAVGLIASVTLVVALTGCNDDDGDVETGTTTTEAVSGTTEPDDGSTNGTLSPDELSTAVWPFADSDTRYDDPVDAATGFAVEFVGFDDPVIGEFMQGDSRSGEVEVQPQADGPVTTVFVRQLGSDDTWWVLGSATENIEFTYPAAGTAIDTPLEVTGEALAFEGTVQVQVRADGTLEPIGDGFVTGGGDVMRPFSGSIPFESPQGGWGAVVGFTLSAENGQVWEASVVRVGFIGGD